MVVVDGDNGFCCSGGNSTAGGSGIRAVGGALDGVEESSIVPPGVMLRESPSTIGRASIPGIDGVVVGVMSVTGLIAVPGACARQFKSREGTTDVT